MDSPEIYELTQVRNELKEAKTILENIVNGNKGSFTHAEAFLKKLEILHG